MMVKKKFDSDISYGVDIILKALEIETEYLRRKLAIMEGLLATHIKSEKAIIININQAHKGDSIEGVRAWKQG